MTYKNLSTDAEHRGGIVRSSVEVSVMDTERRNDVAWHDFRGSTALQEEFSDEC